MGTILIKQLRKGREFFEVDSGVAVRWRAMEDAKEFNGTWSCLCLRLGPRKKILIEMFDRIDERKTPHLVESITDKYMLL